MTPAPDNPATPGDEAQDSILGSLPRSRPSVRSPRRDQAARARQAKAAAAKPTPKERSPRAEAKRPAPGAEKVAPEAVSEDAGVEDLARAGVTTAVQVATAGLRFAGKAAGAIRESLERR
jgi:hypothetical protein